MGQGAPAVSETNRRRWQSGRTMTGATLIEQSNSVADLAARIKIEHEAIKRGTPMSPCRQARTRQRGCCAMSAARHMLDARQVAHALGGEVAGRDTVLAPGPGHRPRDRS